MLSDTTRHAHQCYQTHHQHYRSHLLMLSDTPTHDVDTPTNLHRLKHYNNLLRTTSGNHLWHIGHTHQSYSHLIIIAICYICTYAYVPLLAHWTLPPGHTHQSYSLLITIAICYICTYVPLLATISGTLDTPIWTHPPGW